MVNQCVYSDGSQNQINFKYSGYDCARRVDTEGIWATERPNGFARLKTDIMDRKKKFLEPF